MGLIDWQPWHSRHVAPRPITLWLPDGVPGPYKVVWAHDGQNLFTPERAYAGQDWRLHHALGSLIDEGKVAPAMVVGIGNTPDRLHEYQPNAGAESYLRFVVEELRPAVMQQFDVTEHGHILLGSSMGGIISAYALCRYPELFSGAACVSTHWPADGGSTLGILRQQLPRAGRHRWYFDYGTETADAPYEPYQRRVDGLMRERGYREGYDWKTLKFAGADHSERSWRERVHIPLEFLLPNDLF